MDGSALTSSALKAKTLPVEASTPFPFSFWIATKCSPRVSEPSWSQSRNRTSLVDIPCSQTAALMAGTRVAPRSACILVAHCVRTTTARFRVAASFWRLLTMY